MKTIQYWFSPISPFTYFAGDRLEQPDVQIVFRPFNIAKVFGATGGVPVPQRSPQRQAYRLQELERLKNKTGLPVNLSPKHFPVDSSLACQWMLVVRENGGDVAGIARALLSAVWAEDKNISDTEVLAAIGAQLKIPTEYLEHAADAGELLEQETQAAIEAGVFGSPFYQIEDQLFWGQEKIDEVLELVRQ